MASRAGADSARPRSTRRGMLVIGAAVVVMAVSAAIVWSAYRVMSQQGGTVPLIHADDSPVKVPPANPGGMSVPDQNIAILNGKGPGDSRVEQLLPPPETPLPRPAPAEPPAAESPPMAAPATAMPLPPTAPPPSAPPQAAPAASPAVAAAPPPPPVAAPAPAAPQPAAAQQGYRLQLGALRNEDAARQEWARLKRVNADVLGKLEMRAVRADLGARGVYYRIEAGPIAEATAAQRACETLKQRKVGCILVKP